MEEGEGLDFSVEHWRLLPLPGQPGVQLHAGCGEPLLADRAPCAEIDKNIAQGARQRWRRPVGEEGEEDTMGGTAVVPISSLILVLPPVVATDKVACLPAFSISWKTSSKRVSSSSILLLNLKYERRSSKEHRN